MACGIDVMTNVRALVCDPNSYGVLDAKGNKWFLPM